MPELSEDEFWETYKPLEGPTGQSGSHIWEYAELEGIPTERVWTIVETGGDDENWYALPGVHIVNRIGYAVTDKPWTDEAVTAVWFEVDDDMKTWDCPACGSNVAGVPRSEGCNPGCGWKPGDEQEEDED